MLTAVGKYCNGINKSLDLLFKMFLPSLYEVTVMFSPKFELTISLYCDFEIEIKYPCPRTNNYLWAGLFEMLSAGLKFRARSDRRSI
jgi:hypothetical protein